MGPECSSYKLPRSTKKSRAVLSLDHPEKAMLNTLVCSHGPGQEQATGQHPRVTLGTSWHCCGEGASTLCFSHGAWVQCESCGAFHWVRPNM